MKKFKTTYYLFPHIYYDFWRRFFLTKGNKCAGSNNTDYNHK